MLTRGFAGVGVYVDAVDLGGLDDASLDSRLREIGRSRNRLDGFLTEAVAEKKRRTTPYDTAEALKAELRQSGQQAQRTMRQAEQDDGMWRLFALFDPVTSQRIRAALNHKTHHRNWKVEHHPDTNRPYLKPPWQQPPEPRPRR